MVIVVVVVLPWAYNENEDPWKAARREREYFQVRSSLMPSCCWWVVVVGGVGGDGGGWLVVLFPWAYNENEDPWKAARREREYFQVRPSLMPSCWCGGWWGRLVVGGHSGGGGVTLGLQRERGPLEGRPEGEGVLPGTVLADALLLLVGGSGWWSWW